MGPEITVGDAIMKLAYNNMTTGCCPTFTFCDNYQDVMGEKVRPDVTHYRSAVRHTVVVERSDFLNITETPQKKTRANRGAVNTRVAQLTVTGTWSSLKTVCTPSAPPPLPPPCLSCSLSSTHTPLHLLHTHIPKSSNTPTPTTVEAAPRTTRSLNRQKTALSLVGTFRSFQLGLSTMLSLNTHTGEVYPGPDPHGTGEQTG